MLNERKLDSGGAWIDLLDPTTVADIRRLEGTKSQASSVQALERAVAALREKLGQ
jgi:hypothetical protein